MNARQQGNAVEDLVLLQRLLGEADHGRRQPLWGVFVRRYERLIDICVRKVLRRYGRVSPTRQDVDDVVSDVWLALVQDDMRKLRQYDAARGFRLASFIGLVATNTTIDHLRGKQLRTTPLEDAFDGGAKDPWIVPRDLVEEKERAELARRALVQLSVDERDFFVECFQAERTPDELARELGISTNTVYARKFKIRAKLAGIVATMTRVAAPRALVRS
jgi:RNA polymerase sigma factor (sigma-70 family)